MHNKQNIANFEKKSYLNDIECYKDKVFAERCRNSSAILLISQLKLINNQRGANQSKSINQSINKPSGNH